MRFPKYAIIKAHNHIFIFKKNIKWSCKNLEVCSLNRKFKNECFIKNHRKQSSNTPTWSSQSLVFLVNAGVGLLAMISFSLKGETCFYIFEKHLENDLLSLLLFVYFF